MPTAPDVLDPDINQANTNLACPAAAVTLPLRQLQWDLASTL
jgi:hypothetical protein